MNGSLVIVGLGPAGMSSLSQAAAGAVADPEAAVIVRTAHHPAAEQLSRAREVITCDDLYEEGPDFDAVYGAIADRVLASARARPTVYAVPGSAAVGERSVTMIREAAAAEGLEVRILAGESFLDLLYAQVGVDPIADGVQVLDGRSLPDPLPLHLPTVITQVDRAVVAADVASTLSRILPDQTPVTVLTELGSPTQNIVATTLEGLPRVPVGPRSTVYLDPPPAGWHGLVTTNRRLRAECPWDREQTHHTLVSHLVEEAYETVEALSRLGIAAPGGDPDYGAYAEVEEELGDLLLQVVFHATLAAEAGAFDVEEVAEGIRRKLVRRHPHVFGDVIADEPDVVIANWEHLKAEEKERDSLMDDIPAALPAIARADKMQRRAASVGFDWPSAEPVFAKVHEEIAELRAAAGDASAVAAELGDVLFAVINLSRHLEVDPEMALRSAADTFARRFRGVERLAEAEGRRMSSMSLDEMDDLWSRVKAGE